MSNPAQLAAWGAASGFLSFNFPALIVFAISVVIGLLMVLVFGYASDQKAIHAAKDRLKGHLLALRLFQDQIPVVIRSYGKIVVATGTYLKLAFMPLLWVIVPLTLFIMQADRYLGSTPIAEGQPFLLKVRVATPDAVNATNLQLPPGLTNSAPAVHIPMEKEIAWRLLAEKNGNYEVKVQTGDQSAAKSVSVSTGLPRLSSLRLRGDWLRRMLYSAEPALPQNGTIQSIEVLYPDRDIAFAGFAWNWIWLFFVLSLAAGFLFKSLLGIEI